MNTQKHTNVYMYQKLLYSLTLVRAQVKTATPIDLDIRKLESAI